MADIAQARSHPGGQRRTPRNDRDSNTFIGPLVYSNGINRRSPRSRWRRRRSFCRRFRVLSTGFRFKRRRTRPRWRKDPPNAFKIRQQMQRAPFCRNLGENLGPGPVSTPFLSRSRAQAMFILTSLCSLDLCLLLQMTSSSTTPKRLPQQLWISRSGHWLR